MILLFYFTLLSVLFTLGKSVADMARINAGKKVNHSIGTILRFVWLGVVFYNLCNMVDGFTWLQSGYIVLILYCVCWFIFDAIMSASLHHGDFFVLGTSTWTDKLFRRKWFGGWVPGIHGLIATQIAGIVIGCVGLSFTL